MNTSRNILFLYSDNEAPVVVAQLAEAIARLGSNATVREMCKGQYDSILEAVEIADTVVYWSPDF
jgi:hypothetical protein